MSTQTNLAAPIFQRILHPTDLSPESEFAYAHALRIAVAARAKLDVIHVDRRAHAVDWTELPSIRRRLEVWGLLPKAAPDAENLLRGFEVKKVAAYGTEPIEPILSYLDEAPADLVVVATHQRDGLDRWLHREVAQKLVRKWPMISLFVPFGVSGFISPSTGEATLHRVLLPVDWTPAPQTAVDAVSALATALGIDQLEVIAFHVGDDDRDTPDFVQPDAPGWRWEERLGEGDVVEAILGTAKELEVDLIAMATQGHDGFLDALRGSTTERVLNHAECPVLSVPG